MVYIFSLFGFMMGFGIGLGTINVLLRKRSKQEIQEDKSLVWTYGLIVWVVAGLGGWLGFWIYNNHFL